jgi:hypothetical protein
MQIFRTPSSKELADGLSETVCINKSKGLVDGFVLTEQSAFPRTPFSVWRLSPSGGFCQPRFFRTESEALDCFVEAVGSIRTKTLRVRTRSKKRRRRRRRS